MPRVVRPRTGCGSINQTSGSSPMPRKLKALENIAHLEHKFTHTIDGKAERGASFFDVLNPSTAASFAQCPDATKEQLDRAVASARLAFGHWSQLSFSDRRRYL